ncbi:MAG: radical SAM protein [Ruminococcus flavefaciens]|nr:radical SAM protein [Ruminococcus flavefaciens]
MDILNNVPSGYLRISWYTENTDCLGTDVCFALWVQGCYKRCNGCIARSLQDINGGKIISVDFLADKVTNSAVSELSISGGEPFLQSESLSLLLEKIHAARPDIKIIVYSGMLYEDLIKDSSSEKFLKYIDLLIDGEYIKELDDGKAMRGSSNQRLIFLSRRYNIDDMPEKRKNKLIFYDNKFMMLGIPSVSTKLAMDIMRKKSEG